MFCFLACAGLSLKDRENTAKPSNSGVYNPFESDGKTTNSNPGYISVHLVSLYKAHAQKEIGKRGYTQGDIWTVLLVAPYLLVLRQRQRWQFRSRGVPGTGLRCLPQNLAVSRWCVFSSFLSLLLPPSLRLLHGSAG